MISPTKVFKIPVLPNKGRQPVKDEWTFHATKNGLRRKTLNVCYVLRCLMTFADENNGTLRKNTMTLDTYSQPKRKTSRCHLSTV